MPRGRPPIQPSFSDIVLSDDEELEMELLRIIRNQPTEEELARGKARRAASKRVKSILFDRHRSDCSLAGEKGEWMKVGEVAVIKPNIVFHAEETKRVTYNEGGKTEVKLQVKPAEWQLTFMSGDEPDPINL